MKHTALEQYTKCKEHFSKNDAQMLQKFMFYAQSCRDPLNIYRYMDEKSICTYMPSYWIHKAEYFAEEGDYRNCFECLKQAKSRNGIVDDESEKIYDPQDKIASIRRKMLDEMKRYPIKSKRTVQEFSLLSNNEKDVSGDEQTKNQKLLTFYEKKYSGLRRQKQMKLEKKLESRPVSWLYEHEKQLEEKQKKFEEKLHSNSRKLSRDGNTFLSLNTPVKYKDPMRLTKTMDSVQMLKKKKSTLQKLMHNSKGSFESDGEENSNSQNIEASQLGKHNSVPVGRTFTQLKRRVTFSMDTSMKLEKIRSQLHDTGKSNLMANSNKSEQTEKSKEHLNSSGQGTWDNINEQEKK